MYIPLSQCPWRYFETSLPALPFPTGWVQMTSLRPRIDAWRNWLEQQPHGRWVLYGLNLTEFSAALFALWESEQIAVLANDIVMESEYPFSDQGDSVHCLPTAPPPPTEKSYSHTRINRDNIAVDLYTSGSTGHPLRLPKTFAQLEDELLILHHVLGNAPEAVICQVTPQHIYGFIYGVLFPLCHGLPYCGDENRYPEVLAHHLNFVSSARQSAMIVSSPSQLSRLPARSDWPTRGQNIIISAGSALSSNTARHAASLLKATIIEIYGCSEFGSVASRFPNETDVWTLLPLVEGKFTGTRLQVRSTLSPAGEWCEMADDITRTDTGFHLLKRRDRIVKLASKRVSLDAVERAIHRYPDIMDVHCVPVGNRNERLGAIVCLSSASIPHDHIQRKALIHSLNEHLRRLGMVPFACPRYWRFVRHVPQNPQGKLDQRLIHSLFADISDHRLPRWLGTNQVSAHQAQIELEVPMGLAYLRGHFDQYPIVPGVVLVDWIHRFSQSTFGDPGIFKALSGVKFNQMIRPGMRIELELEKRPQQIAFRITSIHGLHASGRLEFNSREGDSLV